MWLEAYYEAYDLMTANGADSLTELEEPTTTTTTTTTTTPGVCEDIWSSTICADRESSGRCSVSYVITNCQLTCGYC